MTEIKENETIVKEVIRYQAVDGTMFDTKEQCKEYENSAYCVINNRYKMLVVGETDEDELLSGNSDNNVDIVKLKSEDDINILLQYISYKNCYSPDNEILSKRIPMLQKSVEENDVVFIGRNYDDDWAWIIGSLSEVTKKLYELVVDRMDVYKKQ